MDDTELLQLALRSRVLFKLTLLLRLSPVDGASPPYTVGVAVPVVFPMLCRLTAIILVIMGKPVSGWAKGIPIVVLGPFKREGSIGTTAERSGVDCVRARFCVEEEMMLDVNEGVDRGRDAGGVRDGGVRDGGVGDGDGVGAGEGGVQDERVLVLDAAVCHWASLTHDSGRGLLGCGAASCGTDNAMVVECDGAWPCVGN